MAADHLPATLLLDFSAASERPMHRLLVAYVPDRSDCGQNPFDLG